jgi:molybdenum cofactor biosynthesis enzyme
MVDVGHKQVTRRAARDGLVRMAVETLAAPFATSGPQSDVLEVARLATALWPEADADLILPSIVNQVRNN